MSDFFEPLLPPLEPAVPPDFRLPEWDFPPENEVGVAAAVPVALIRTEGTAIFIAGFTVFSTGLWFTLAVRHRERFRRQPSPSAVHPLAGPHALRFGIQLAGGAKATTTRSLTRGTPPSPPHLAMRGVQGHGGRGFDVKLWLWPLPPPGPLAFVLEWPEQQISLTRCELDAQPILDAAVRVEELWPDERPLPTGPWTHVDT